MQYLFKLSFRNLILLLCLPVIGFLTACGDDEETLTALVDSRDGQVYAIVQIGDQVWMAENLNYDPAAGNSWCYHKDIVHCDAYGKLYDWQTARMVAPEGWHLPSDEEWGILIDHLGVADAGGKMKEAGLDHWLPPNTGATNSSGFNALPAGVRYASDDYFHFEESTNFWSSTEHDELRSWGLLLDYESSQAIRNYGNKESGSSVRCVKD